MLAILTKWTRWRTILVGVVVIISVATLSLLSAHGDAAESSNDEIARAAVAPYILFLEKNAEALCDAFTGAAAYYLAADAGSNNCMMGMGTEFANSTRVATLPVLTGTKRLKVEKIDTHGDQAVVEVLYYDRGISSMKLRLERVSNKWRVSTRPLLTTLKGCLPHVACPPGTRTLLFAISFPGKIEFVKHATPNLLHDDLSRIGRYPRP